MFALSASRAALNGQAGRGLSAGAVQVALCEIRKFRAWVALHRDEIRERAEAARKKRRVR